MIAVLLIFFLVYSLIVIRRFGRFNIPIWLAMLLGATLMLGMGLTTIDDAAVMINADVIVFLFGMLVIISAMEYCGLLQWLTNRMLKMASSPTKLLFLLMFTMGFASAFLVNDTIALMATPMVISMCRQANLNVKPYLIALAVSVTIGSALTPVGNPQNLLIAIAFDIPFLDFMIYMVLPVITNLVLTFFVIRLFYRKNFSKIEIKAPDLKYEEIVRYPWLAKLSGICAMIATIGFLLSSFLDLRLSVIALTASTILLLFTDHRREIVQRIEWSILIFFASMFIVIGTMEESGLVDEMVNYFPFPSSTDSSGIFMLAVVSVFFGQIFSNVPFVALAIPIIKGTSLDTKAGWMTLAGASTFAGNLTILGAASNVIVIEAAETRGETITFKEFLKIGVPITVINILVLVFFLIMIF